MTKKILLSIIMIVLVVGFANVVNALDEIISQGNKFHGTDEGLGANIADFLNGNIVSIITGIGNLVFAAITVILGVKYIWSSAEGKAEVMESLPNFVVAVVFFYLGEEVFNFVTGATSSISGAGSWATLSGNIIWIINTFVKYLALAGIIFIGIRYMFASADGRASMKTSMGGMAIGILFVFLASNVVDFIIKVTEEVIV